MLGEICRQTWYSFWFFSSVLKICLGQILILDVALAVHKAFLPHSSFLHIALNNIPHHAHIPDTHPVSFMTNFYLYYYESKWLLRRKERDLWKACIFSNILEWCLSCWAGAQEGKWRSLQSVVFQVHNKHLKLSCCSIKKIPFNFISIACPILVAIFHLKQLSFNMFWSSTHYQDNNRPD